MVVKIAQPLKVFPSVRNKKSGNYENPEITPSAKFIIEGIIHMY